VLLLALPNCPAAEGSIPASRGGTEQEVSPPLSSSDPRLAEKWEHWCLEWVPFGDSLC